MDEFEYRKWKIEKLIELCKEILRASGDEFIEVGILGAGVVMGLFGVGIYKNKKER